MSEDIKPSKPEPPVTSDGRAKLIMQRADNQEEIVNASECMMEFQQMAKTIDSPHAAKALKAAAWLNRLRVAVELEVDNV